MDEDSQTRSSLLWQVKRLLNETEQLPQILLMENVRQVVGDKNMANFQKWCSFLESKGYTNKWAIMNAKDYGIPQNRERCFMLSWLGDYYYEFPEPIKLNFLLKDFLEDEVDEKYYLDDSYVKSLIEQMNNETSK